MVLLKSTVCLLLIIAVTGVKSIKPTCSSNCTSDRTRENSPVGFFCHVPYTGGNKPALTWKWKLFETEVKNVPTQQQFGSIIRRDFYFTVSSPVPELFCTDGQGEKCTINSCKILHSPRNVITLPLGIASPNETITCFADGNPKPTIKWEWKELGGVGGWTDVPESDGKKEIVATLSENGNTVELRCVATNELNSVNSVPLIVTEGGAAIRTKIIIGVVVGVVVLAVIVGVAYFCFK